MGISRIMANLGKIAGCLIAISLFTQLYANNLQIHCLDVGQGDATIVISPTGKTMLVDAGKNGQGYSKILPYLDSLNITSLDYIVATHYHEDHIGGIDEIVDVLGLDSIKEAVYDRAWSYTTQTYDDYVAAVENKRDTIMDGQVIDLGGGALLACVAVNGNGRLDPPFVDSVNNENDFCVALVISYNNFQFFVAGDLSGQDTLNYTDIETSVAPEVGDIEVYQVDHHGSIHSSNPYFVSTLLPDVSVISVGSNSYGHPDPTIVARLDSAGTVYQTEDSAGNIIDGDVVITTDGMTYIVNGDTFICEGIEEKPDLSELPSFALSVCPNPFIASTVVSYSVASKGHVSLDIYDITGRLIMTLVEGEKKAGNYSAKLNTKALTSGVYFVMFVAGDYCHTKKLIFMH